MREFRLNAKFGIGCTRIIDARRVIAGLERVRELPDVTEKLQGIAFVNAWTTPEDYSVTL